MLHTNALQPRKKVIILQHQWKLFKLVIFLKSWLHEIFIHFRTVSPWLEDNYDLKCNFAIFPHTKYLCHIAWKTVRTTLPCIVVLQLRGEGHKKRERKKTMGQICPLVFLVFRTFSMQLEKKQTSKCSSNSLPGMVKNMLCMEILSQLNFKASVSSNRGETVLDRLKKK